jgi:hypothetical protein
LQLDSKEMIFDVAEFERFMGELLWEKPQDSQIMRCKGTFIAKNQEEATSEYMLQGVDEVFEFKDI